LGVVANWGAPESFRELRCVHRAAKERYIYNPRRSPVKRKPYGYGGATGKDMQPENTRV
jgi:hypothetical protein